MNTARVAVSTTRDGKTHKRIESRLEYDLIKTYLKEDQKLKVFRFWSSLEEVPA